jgi:ferric-dicitrate binding protein FerR (iron transport regulator)
MSETEANKDIDRELESLLQEVGAREQPSPEMMAAVREVVHAEWAQAVHDSRRARRRHAVFAIAASVVLTAGIVFYALPHLRAEAPTVARVDRIVGSGAVVIAAGSIKPMLANAAIRIDQTLRTTSNARLVLQVAPHLQVRMDQDSEVTFAAADRVVLSQGAVYVDAAGPEARALVIDTPFGKVQHIGTQYETRLDAGTLRIRVRTGEVKVVSDAGATTAQAGEQVSVSKSGVSREPIAVSGSEWQWLAQLAARFDIENHSLAEFLVWAGRETGCEIVYASDRARDVARQVILHGSVAGLTPDSALAAVLSTTRFTYKQSTNRITVNLGP